MATSARRTAWAALACGLIVLGSCASKDRLPCHPATGRVLLGDKPLAGAELWLFPDDPEVSARQPPVRPYAKSAADGSFTLMTYVTGDGAPAGDYQVRIICEKKGKKVAGPADDEETAGLVNTLPARYADPERSGLRATIRPGKNEIASFVLKK